MSDDHLTLLTAYMLQYAHKLQPPDNSDLVDMRACPDTNRRLF